MISAGGVLRPMARAGLLKRSLGKGMRRSRNQWKEASFHWMRARHSVNEDFGKEFFRKDNSVNSVKRSRPFSEPPDSLKIEIFCMHPLPRSWLLVCLNNFFRIEHKVLSHNGRNLLHYTLLFLSECSPWCSYVLTLQSLIPIISWLQF